MEQKIRYQYTYFIYPYIIPQNKYAKYVKQLLEDKRCKLQFFDKEKQVELFDYFLPNIRRQLFPSFEWNELKKKKFQEMSKEMQVNVLCQNTCNLFEYQLEKQIQAKTEDQDGIFFQIDHIQMVCFSTGICFLLFKTSLSNSQQLEDILDFNCKFRKLPGKETLTEFEKIKIQTDLFENRRQFSELITYLAGNNTSASQFDINKESFLTYSYVCLDQEYWNEMKPFEELKHLFYKYSNLLPSNYQVSLEEQGEINLLSETKYSKIGVSQIGTCLMTSGIDTYNYTKLPYLYETTYLYTYLFSLYERIYLKKLNLDYQKASQTKSVRKEFIHFMQKLGLEEITNDTKGKIFYQKEKEILEIQKLYDKLKERYALLYKELNIEKTLHINYGIMVVLIVLLLLNLWLFGTWMSG